MITILKKYIIIIGSSTGGPKILSRVFLDLPKLNASVILVQHMPKFINESLRDSLNRKTEMDIKIAEDGERIIDGKVYLAPSEVHLELINNRTIRLFNGEKINFVKPAIDVAMNSMNNKHNDNIVGVILTGMGKDGAKGLSHIKNIGGNTISQDKETSIIYGMPKAAFETGDVDYVLTPEQVKDKLIELVGTMKRIDIVSPL